MCSGGDGRCCNSGSGAQFGSRTVGFRNHDHIYSKRLNFEGSICSARTVELLVSCEFRNEIRALDL